jgi:glycosyltransferase involved in cell wall biosynthesis
MPPPIKIVHVVHSLNVGGLENGVVNLLNHLDGRFSHTVVCLSTSGPMAERITNRNVSVVEMGLPTDRFRFPVGRLARLFRQISPTIVHTRNWATIDAIVAARLARVPSVIHGEHGREATDPGGKNGRRNLIRKGLSPLVTRFVTVSDDLKRWLTQTVGIPERKVTRIYNGVDTERFTPMAAQGAAGSRQRAERSVQQAEIGEQCVAGEGQKSAIPNPQSAIGCLRQRLGLPVEATLFGTVGRLDPVKDHATLLQAFAISAKHNAHARLLIVGDGPRRQEIESQIKQLHMGGSVHLLGERPDVVEILKTFDVFALTSVAEGISNTILEAMASGLPVVATRVGGNPELVEDGITGQLVPARDASALSAAFGSYMRDAALRFQHGSAGRARVENEFSLERMAAQYADLYDSMAQSA